MLYSIKNVSSLTSPDPRHSDDRAHRVGRQGGAGSLLRGPFTHPQRDRAGGQWDRKSPGLPPQRCDLGLGLPVHSYCITILKNKFNYSSYHLYSLTHLFTLSTRVHPVYSVTLFTHIPTCHSYITFHSLTPLALSYFHTLSHNYSFFLTNSLLHIMSLFSPILSNSYIYHINPLYPFPPFQAPPTRWT